jgi:hypothetical protein
MNGRFGKKAVIKKYLPTIDAYVRYDSSVARCPRVALVMLDSPLGGDPVSDFLIGMAFVAMVLGPAIFASVQHSRSRDDA